MSKIDKLKNELIKYDRTKSICQATVQRFESFTLRHIKLTTNAGDAGLIIDLGK